MKIRDAFLPALLFAVTAFLPSFAVAQGGAEEPGLLIDVIRQVRSPFIDLNYGMGNPSINDDMFSWLPAAPEFTPVSCVDLRIGHKTEEVSPQLTMRGLLKESRAFLFLSRYSHEMGGSTDPGKLNASFWSFGIGGSEGFGYGRKDSPLDIMLNSGRSIKWTSTDFDNYNALVDTNIAGRLGAYHDKTKFGDSWEAQVRLEYGDFLSLNLGYGQSMVMPAHVFWPWLGSQALQGITSRLLEGFLAEIAMSSPTAGPVVHFILMNALSYGFYALRRSDMNWPFDYDSPMMIDEFKVGLGFDF